jgi:DNA (cytosine-5)-methyltransferase 1
MGFDARWGVLRAADVGANHQRDRIWIVAKMANSSVMLGYGGNDNARIGMERETQSQLRNDCGTNDVAYTSEVGLCGKTTQQRMVGEFRFAEGGMDRNWWAREPESTPRTIERNMGQVADGVAARVDRLKAIGNGQVPLCAATAWKCLTKDWQ